MYNAVGAGGGPFCQTNEFGFGIVFQELGLFVRLQVFERMVQPCRAAIIAFADHQRSLECGIALQFGNRIEQLTTKIKVFAANLFL